MKVILYLIKARAAAIGVKLKDLCAEVNKRGERIAPTNFSNAINGKLDRPQADRVRQLAYEILDEWEKKERKTHWLKYSKANGTAKAEHVYTVRGMG